MSRLRQELAKAIGGRALVAAVLVSMLWACGDDEEREPADAGVADTAVDTGARRDVDFETDEADVDDDAAIDDVEGDTEADTAADDAGPDVADVNFEVSVDIGEDAEGVFPPPAEGACVDGGDGAQGTLRFSDGEPLVNATVGLIREGEKLLGYTDEAGHFLIQAPCEELVLEVAVFETENHPAHPSIWNLPIGTFDAGTQTPVFEIPLVPVSGTIVDVVGDPIAGARLDAQLTDGRVEVFNTDEADEAGVFTVYLIPWSSRYDLTAQGPEGGEKRYRSITLSVLIEDPPPDPSTFVLFEDRCSVNGGIVTSEGTALEWLYLRVEGDPYPEGPYDYVTFEEDAEGEPVYYPYGDSANLLDQIPLWCGTQSLRLWNAIWVNPDWPCKDHDNPDQLCLNNYPLWFDTALTESRDDVVIPVVRIGGTVRDEFGLTLPDVTVRFEGRYQWGESRFDSMWVMNETVTDDEGHYSMVVIPFPAAAEVPYAVTTRIRDDDRRPLGSFECGTADSADCPVVSEAGVYDIVVPEGAPRCILDGTIHSNEGRDFTEIMVTFDGDSIPEEGEDPEPLYVDPPWNFFSPEIGTWYRAGFEDEEVPFVPMLCGVHDLRLSSADWPSCNMSPDEVCFQSWTWWFNQVVDEPITDGIQIPVVHVSGYVTTEDGTPVEGASVSAVTGFPPFFFVMNGTGTGPDGLYDFVVLPCSNRRDCFPLCELDENCPTGMACLEGECACVESFCDWSGVEWGISVSVGDDHPMNLTAVDATEVIDDAVQINFEMPPGPPRCPFSGTVHTDEGVDLEALDFYHFGAPYGMAFWQFRSLIPGIYFRYPNDEILLDAIPLICGVQSMEINSIESTRISSCVSPENFDQPCLDFYRHWDGFDLQEPVEGVELPVVWIRGEVTRNGEEPISGAEIAVRSVMTVETGEECDVDTDCTDADAVCNDAGACERTVRGLLLETGGGDLRNAGGVSNYAVSRPDGRYSLVVVPTPHSQYEITITTPLGVDLGEATYERTVNADIVVDADFTD